MSLDSIKEQTITCPHCGHHTHVTIDPSNGDQDYYEECSNCYQELRLITHIDQTADKLDVDIDTDDEQIY